VRLSKRVVEVGLSPDGGGTSDSESNNKFARLLYAFSRLADNSISEKRAASTDQLNRVCFRLEKSTPFVQGHSRVGSRRGIHLIFFNRNEAASRCSMSFDL
jgi:hypothetical protein